jgi:hypothetical protein
MLDWGAGPSSRSRDDPRYVYRAAPMGLRALTPLSPVRLAARRLNSGDVEIDWIRRTRIEGDNFEVRDVRLGEDFEAYQVEIVDAGETVRTIETEASRTNYAYAQQIADFGAAPSELMFVVRQLSAAVGPGSPARASVVL